MASTCTNVGADRLGARFPDCLYDTEIARPSPLARNLLFLGSAFWGLGGFIGEEQEVKIGRIVIMILGLLSLFTLPRQLLAGLEEYALVFIPTQNASPGIKGTMTIKVDAGKPGTKVEFTTQSLV